jgi:hypothetical protein
VPTITLTIDAETLAAMQRGEAVQLTATLRAKKPKQAAALTPEQEVLHRSVADLLHDAGATALIPKVWKDIRGKLADQHPADIMNALDLCVDWCRDGLEKSIGYFAHDYAAWLQRTQGDLMAQEVQRGQWRKARGVT